MSKIKDGLKLRGNPVDIPECDRNDLPEFFKEMGYKVGAEIGVYMGEYTKVLLDAGLKVYGIDPWLAYHNYKSWKNQGLGEWQHRQDDLYKQTKTLLKPHIDSGLCTLIKKTSMDAVEEFKDDSLDFVYIDGHHGLRYVTEDLVEWSKKVKKGGVISGHDYAYNAKKPRDNYCLQVRYALQAFMGAFRIRKLYVLGRKHILKKGEKRDQWRSWFYIRKHD